MSEELGVPASSGGRAATASQPSPQAVSGIAGIPNAETFRQIRLLRTMLDAEIAKDGRTSARVEALEAGLSDCVKRLRRCAENGGNAPFAVDALCAQFEALLPCQTKGAEDIEPGCCGPCRARAAQGIEAASADETRSGSAEGESPVGEADAPQTQQSSTPGDKG